VLLDAFMLPQDDLDRIEERCGVMAALRDDALASPAINVGTIADLQAVNIYDYPDGTLAWVSGHQCFYSLSHGARDWRQL
jgi:hypothetical protein